MKHREVHLKSRPQGTPTRENFDVVEVETPSPRDGEILVRNEWMSVDPYMRGRMREGKSYVPPFQLGEPMEGGCVGKVLESKCEGFAEGDYVLGDLGWREAWCAGPDHATKIDPAGVPTQAYLGVLGMPGMTAYVGLTKIGGLQASDRVFVSAASGAVGSVVCQIAKLKGCFIVGSAGSKKKIDWLKEKAGVDAAFDYHQTEDVSATLAELAPEGIDLYFDNVGGDHLEAAIGSLNDFGRIVACGMIATYNEETPPPGPRNLFLVVAKRLRMQGFIVRDSLDLQPEFHRQMTQWITDGQIVWEETVTEGLENAPEAFLNLFRGDKLGKALVKL